jgi:TetR/AcrR family transcriptional regulator
MKPRPVKPPKSTPLAQPPATAGASDLRGHRDPRPRTPSAHSAPASDSPWRHADGNTPAPDAQTDAIPPASETARALIAAGRKLFARRGYDGASVRAITEEAGANLGAITYHFGSKHGLYDAVVAECLGPFAERVVEVASAEGTALDRLAEVVRAYFEHLWDNPDLPFLMMQELAAGRLPPPSAQSALRRMLGALSGLIVFGQSAGEIREGEPVLMAFSVIAQPVHLTVVRPVAALIAGIDQDGVAARERLVNHVVTFVRRGLEPDAPRGRRRDR